MEALTSPELVLAVANVDGNVFVFRFRQEICRLEARSKLGFAIDRNQPLVIRHLDEAATILINVGSEFILRIQYDRRCNTVGFTAVYAHNVLCVRSNVLRLSAGEEPLYLLPDFTKVLELLARGNFFAVLGITGVLRDLE